MAKRQIYCSSYCNFGHYLDTGRPIDHECIVIPPEALALERDGDVEGAIQILAHASRKTVIGR